MQASQSSSHDVVSQERLDELNTLIGEQLPLVLNTYIDTSSINVDELLNAQERRDYIHMASVCHKLKGSASSIGATNLPQLCVQLEELLNQTKDINEIPKVLSMIQTENSGIIHTLKNYLNSLNT